MHPSCLRKIKDLILVSTIFCCWFSEGIAQIRLSAENNIVFTVNRGSVARPESVIVPSSVKSAFLNSGDTANFKIISLRQGKLLIAFSPPGNFTGISTATIKLTNTGGQSISEINLTGICSAKPFIELFDGKTLDGWHSYLKNYGSGKDPDQNFRIEDSVLHVIGKDLGYIMTDSGYTNFHFKVEFKWGESKWPPRDTSKRDAGICYNIPVNAPDSVWPQSIECQIQEGDVGDFWLVGFSTISVRDTVNVASPFTRMIKYADAEKPNGEWNTVEVISYNGRCIHIVNGVVVNVGDKASNTSGRILLQSEYAEVYYRKMQIRKL